MVTLRFKLCDRCLDAYQDALRDLMLEMINAHGGWVDTHAMPVPCDGCVDRLRTSIIKKL